MLAIYSPNHDKKCCWTKILIFLPFWDSGGPRKRSKIQFCHLFSQAFHFFRDYWSTQVPKKFWTGFFILGPVCDLGPETCPKWPKTKNRTSLSVFHPGFSSFQYVISFVRQKMLLDRNFDLGPRFGYGPYGPEIAQKIENRTFRSSFELRFSHASNLLT